MENSDLTAHHEVECKDCGNRVPEIDCYRPWCECGWNIHMQEDDLEVKGFLVKYYLEISKKRGKTIYESLQAAPNVKSSFTISMVLLYILSFFVLVASIITFSGGIAILSHTPRNVFAVFLGLAALGLTWLVFPRVPKVPLETVSEKQCPQLWNIVKRISKTLDTNPPEFIELVADYNACVWRHGYKQKKVLTLGVPLLLALKPQERVAVVAHEMGHFTNGDPARGIIVGLAIQSLVNWYTTLHPGEIRPEGEGPSSVIGNVMMLVLAQVPYCLFWIAIHLQWDNSNVCEYVADRLASEVSGTDAMMSALTKTHLDSHFLAVVQKYVLDKHEGSMMDRLQEYFGTMPSRELERIRRQCELVNLRLDSTHPPTTWRQKMLESRIVVEPMVKLSEEDNEMIDEELKLKSNKLEKELRDDYLSSIYF